MVSNHLALQINAGHMMRLADHFHIQMYVFFFVVEKSAVTQ